MPARVVLLLLLAFLPPIFGADQMLRYEPEVVEISGKVFKAQQQHPNGTWMHFWGVKLNVPADIKDDGAADSFNEAEQGVTEIQIYSNEKALQKKFDSLEGKQATMKGTVFHAHTAWHTRPLVMMVQAVVKK